MNVTADRYIQDIPREVIRGVSPDRTNFDPNRNAVPTKFFEFLVIFNTRYVHVTPLTARSIFLDYFLK